MENQPWQLFPKKSWLNTALLAFLFLAAHYPVLAQGEEYLIYNLRP